MASLSRSTTREHELALLLAKHNIDVAIISEAEVPSGVILSFPGYSTIPAPPDGKGMVRLLIILRSDLASSAEVISAAASDLWVKLAGPITIGGIYRLWRTEESEDTALAALHGRMAAAVAGCRDVLVAGDINLDSNRMGDATYSRRTMLRAHLEKVQEFGLTYAGPFTPTYTSFGRYGPAKEKRSSCIDHVYTAGVCDGAIISTLSNSSSDHLPVHIVIPRAKKVTNTIKSIEVRSWGRVTGPALLNELSVDTLNKVYSIRDVDEAHAAIVREVTRALDVIAPIRTVIVKDRSVPLSLAPDTLQAMAERDKAAATNHKDYRALRNKAARKVRRDKVLSSLKEIDGCKGDYSRLWRFANATMGKGRSGGSLPDRLVDIDGNVVSGPEIPDAMNNFYITKVRKVRESIKALKMGGEEKEEDTGGDSSAFSFTEPTVQGVKRTILALNNTPAIGNDGIPIGVWKMAADAVVGPIAHLVTLSIRQAKVPWAFKEAYVNPVFKGKGKSPSHMNSYRPVSVLPALSKILEQVISQQLNSYLKDKLPGQQYGFRAGRNCVEAISAAHGGWVRAAAKGKAVAVAAFDFTAAFDTLDLGVMVTKLSKLGIGGRSLMWIRSYLSGRSQRLRYAGSMSGALPVECGVPQGSILGPLLFICLVADLPRSLAAVDSVNGDELGGCVSYADDVVAWTTGNNVEVARDRMERKARVLYSYSSRHYLSLNPEKTQFMWAGKGSACNNSTCIDIVGTFVKPVPSMDILGVSFDSLLRPLPFLQGQLRAAKAIRGTINRLALHLPRGKLLKTVATALVSGKLTYGAAAAYPLRHSDTDANDGTLKDIQVVVNDIARAISGRRRSSRIRIGDLLEQTGIPSLNRAAVRAVAVEAWKAATRFNGLSDPLADLLGKPGSMVRSTRAASASHLPPPLPAHAKTFVWEAFKLWNGHESLRTAPSLAAAKRVAVSIATKCPI